MYIYMCMFVSQTMYFTAKYKYLLYDQPFYLIYAGHPPINANKLKLNRFFKITTTWMGGHFPPFENVGRITQVSV